MGIKCRPRLLATAFFYDCNPPSGKQNTSKSSRFRTIFACSRSNHVTFISYSRTAACGYPESFVGILNKDLLSSGTRYERISLYRLFYKGSLMVAVVGYVGYVSAKIATVILVILVSGHFGMSTHMTVMWKCSTRSTTLKSAPFQTLYGQI